MYDDLYRIYVEWSETSGRTSFVDFSAYVYTTTGVMLSDVLTDEERETILSWFKGDTALLEGIDSGP